jgi:alpha-beta hydrolase superfamily lysophospholipase
VPTGQDDPAAPPPPFTTADGLALATRAVWPPAGTRLRAAVVVVHGLGDHCGSASGETLYGYLAPRGIACLAYDQRGCGRSPGPRVHARSFALLRDDLARFVDVARARVGDVPLFLLGLSFGGLQVLDCALARPQGLAGVVSVAPALGEARVPKPLRAIAPLLSRALPRLRLDPGLDLDNLSKDPVAVRAYIDDPLFERKVTARLGFEAMKAMREVAQAAPRFRVPLFILHGDADRITSPDSSRAFHAAARSPDKTLRLYPGAVHDPLIDRERDDVVRDIAAWLDARIPPAPAPASRA